VQFFVRSIRSTWQFARCSYSLMRMRGPIVSVFGGGRVQKGSDYARLVHNFASLCASSGLSVLTGGGPGAMEAANCGVRDAVAAGRAQDVDTLGIGVYGLDEGFVNPCASVLNVTDFSTRKRLLMCYSCAFVAFPGGIGTMDEIFALLNLIKHSHFPRIPIILVDAEYWHDLVQWYTQVGLERGLIGPSSREMLLVADTSEQALALIQERLNLSRWPKS